MAKKKALPSIETAPGLVRAVESVGGGDAPTFYVNNISIDLSSFDVRLRLGQIQGATESVLKVKDTAYVYMSHQHFMALVDAVNGSAAKLAQMPPISRVAVDEKAK